MKKRLIMASCYPIIREALLLRLEKQQDVEVLADTDNSEDAIELCQKLSPDILIIDIDMPLLSGLDVTRRVKIYNPSIKVLILSVTDDFTQITGIRNAGADGYIPKKATLDKICHSIRLVSNGQNSFPGAFSNHIQQINENSAESLHTHKHKNFSLKELHILKRVAAGKSNKDIALGMDLTEANIKSTLAAIFAKLGVSSRTSCVAEALKSGIISIEDLIQS